ncbi:MAG: LysR family transcriptional regulator, partial [Spirochaetia bacterium]|nr:LysR family transcriptional regulator [Spirochaetia bacterium]
MDTRFSTFLSLCSTLNYRKTAEDVHLSQPAVTKQIQSLEQEYSTKLFDYKGRSLSLREEGMLFKRFAESQRYNEQELISELACKPQDTLRLGATKSIGDSVLDSYLISYLKQENRNISLMVENTTVLLAQLEAAQLDFVVLEGLFPKKHYAYRLLRRETFVGICAKDHPFAGKSIPVPLLQGQNLITREPGSGTRNIFERELQRQGYDLSLFPRVTEISNFQPLKKLVSNGLGISFVYQSVADTD